jgi:hypothetical protein
MWIQIFWSKLNPTDKDGSGERSLNHLTNGGQKILVMETREAILNLEYSEKMKSGLIIGVGLLNQLMSFKGEELSGGKKILVGYLEGLLREVRIAGNVLGSDHYMNLEQKVMEVIGRVQMSQLGEALRSFSEAISLATTLCQSSMTLLMEKKLV